MLEAAGAYASAAAAAAWGEHARGYHAAQTQTQAAGHVLPSLGAHIGELETDQARLAQLNRQRGLPEGGLPSVSHLLQK